MLHVHGQPLALRAFVEKARAGADPLSFHTFVPQPADLIGKAFGHGTFVRRAQSEWCRVEPTTTALNLKAPAGTWAEQHQWLCNRLAELGYDVRRFPFVQYENGVIEERSEDAPDPLSWRSEHWGTKWDAYDFEDGHEDDPNGTNWRLSFYTAWAPPVPVIHAMQAQHPELSLELRFSEPGMSILGAVRPDGSVEEVELSLSDGDTEREDFDPYDGLRDFLYN